MAFSFAGETAWHLYLWYRDNRFCGRCGSRTQFHLKERAMECPECKNVIYPKIAPAVIVGITDGDSIVVTRYKGREYKGIALVAGFCEIGESMEDTVRREVMEEVGLKVKNIRYYKSQPWGFDQNILAGYYCELDGERKITRQEDELSVAEWITRDELQEQTNIISLTAEMIENFRRNGNINK
jgi:NAD+ diphosphatase